MKILFHSEQVCERGTEVANYDYAAGNEKMLGGISFFAAPADRVFDNDVLHKFKKRFAVLLYKNQEEIASFIRRENIDLLFKIVSGEKQSLPDIKIPFFISCAFDTREPFGTWYCPVSDFINRHFGTRFPVMPVIIKKFSGSDENLRSSLGIPSGVTVFGSYGGSSSFSIPFVKETVIKTAREHKDIYFLFMNFTPFVDGGEGQKNIIFLPRQPPEFKERFINTCDAMLHARIDGETFGNAIGEFSVKNKPIITFAPDLIHNTKLVIREYYYSLRRYIYPYARAHLDFLGDKAIRYTSERDLTDILLHFREKYLKFDNYDCYSERFSEEKVMRIFEGIITGKYKNNIDTRRVI